MLGVMSQCVAEITVLAEKGGVSRTSFLDFINNSALGSDFTRYKTPALLDLDFTPTFTSRLLLKDLHLGLEAARDLEVPMTLAATAQETVARMIGLGYGDVDFAALLELQAKASSLELAPESADLSDGPG
jgi:3-hydroxyisobutyrate dehydrogenase-like beta-hydroxyacid dehydrogenase